MPQALSDLGFLGARRQARKSEMSSTLVLTATITPPPSAINLTRTDPALRLRDYLWALEFYLKLPDEFIGRIVFVENSGSDLSELRALAAKHPQKRVEFVSFHGLDYPPEYGRGHGEFKLLDYAMEHSEILSRLDPCDLIWKATGRLRLMNIGRLIATARRQYTLYCDRRDWPLPYMDLRFYSVKICGYNDYLKLIYINIVESRFNHCSEFYMRSEVGAWLGRPGIVPRFRIQPQVDGIQGMRNTSYSMGWSNRAKNVIRSIGRRVAPNLWI